MTLIFVCFLGYTSLKFLHSDKLNCTKIVVCGIDKGHVWGHPGVVGEIGDAHPGEKWPIIYFLCSKKTSKIRVWCLVARN